MWQVLGKDFLFWNFTDFFFWSRAYLSLFFQVNKWVSEDAFMLIDQNYRNKYHSNVDWSMCDEYWNKWVLLRKRYHLVKNTSEWSNLTERRDLISTLWWAPQWSVTISLKPLFFFYSLTFFVQQNIQSWINIS